MVSPQALGVGGSATGDSHIIDGGTTAESAVAESTTAGHTAVGGNRW